MPKHTKSTEKGFVSGSELVERVEEAMDDEICQWVQQKLPDCHTLKLEAISRT